MVKDETKALFLWTHSRRLYLFGLSVSEVGVLNIPSFSISHILSIDIFFTHRWFFAFPNTPFQRGCCDECRSDYLLKNLYTAYSDTFVWNWGAGCEITYDLDVTMALLPWTYSRKLHPFGLNVKYEAGVLIIPSFSIPLMLHVVSIDVVSRHQWFVALFILSCRAFWNTWYPEVLKFWIQSSIEIFCISWGKIVPVFSKFELSLVIEMLANENEHQ